MDSSHLFSPEFEDRYTNYPKFTRLSQPVTETARANSAMEAIRRLCGRTSNLGSGILEGLGILDAQGNIRPYDSSYAGYFLKLLNDKPDGQVINRGEVIEQVAGGIQPVEKDMKFYLEPEWVSVILLALVYNGDIVLSLDGREELDAGSLERSLTRSMTDIINFRFYKRPRTLPINLWSMIFEGLGLQPGLVRDENTRENAVTELQRLVHAELEMVVQLQNRLEQGAQLWNTPIFTDRLTFVVEQGTVVGSDAPDFSLSSMDLLPGLRGYKQFLEELSKYTTVGKLRNLRYIPGQIQENLEYRLTVLRARQLLDAINQIQPYTTYLAEAQANLPEDHEWTQHARQVQKNTLDSIRRFGKGNTAFDQQAVLRELTKLKQDYIKIYSDLHRKSVLTASGDDLRQRLYRDARFESMRALSAIELLTRSGDFEFWKQQLTGLVSCREFHEGVLTDSPTCPYCHLRPAQLRTAANSDALVHLLDDKLSDLLKNWRKALRDNLNSATAQHSLEAMSPAERKPVEDFLQQGDDAETLPANFVPSAIQALRGIQAVTLPVDALLQALKAGGLPCTREELQNRFKQFLDQQMRGHDAGNTRLTLDQ